MMNKTIKRRWVKALRSGEYKQGYGTLCQTVDGVDEFCVMGVFIDSTVIGDWEVSSWQYYLPDGKFRTFWTFEGFRTIIADDFLQKAGISTHLADNLTLMNDGRYTFDQLADWIEEML